MRDFFRHWHRRTMLVTLASCAGVVLLSYTSPERHQPGSPRRTLSDWPAISREAKPWTRWWWHGSAVDPASLTAQLEALRDAGIGGVEITPIYGVRGEEAQFIPFLSDRWLRMLEHTLREANRLDLGVDMATGTGWPFGGPWVGDETSSRTIAHKTWTLAAGERLAEPVRLRQAPLLRAIGTRPRRSAPPGSSSHSDRGPRRTGHREPQPAGAGARSGEVPARSAARAS